MSDDLSSDQNQYITVIGASHHNLKNLHVRIPRGKITVVTGVSGSGKSSLVYDVILNEANRMFLATLSHFARQFVELSAKVKVRKILGLSPAIGLSQRETEPSARAGIASFTDLGELLGLLFTHYGQYNCPIHLKPTINESVAKIAERLVNMVPKEQMLGVLVPIATKKSGGFVEVMERLALRGYARIIIDQKSYSLSAPPILEKNKKHTIKVVIDVLKNKGSQSLARLIRSLETAFKEGQGYAEYCLWQGDDQIAKTNFESLSTHGGCAECGYSWPKLDPRYFSPNSLGGCKRCHGFGYEIEAKKAQDQEKDKEITSESFQEFLRCSECQGTGLDLTLKAIVYQTNHILDLHNMPLHRMQTWVRDCLLPDQIIDKNHKLLLEEIATRCAKLCQLGLGHLSLRRKLKTLSYGELQRLRLAHLMGSNLSGVLYVLDEPSQGLHHKEIDVLWQALQELKDQNNTIIVIEHDEEVIGRADWIIDLGPGGGAHGGQLVAQFAPKEAVRYASLSQTAQAICAYKQQNKKVMTTDYNPGRFIHIVDPVINNLKIKEISIPLGCFIIVRGVSGAGKNSLIMQVLAKNIAHYLACKRKKQIHQPFQCRITQGLENLQSLEVIDRKPIGKSFFSSPATYLEILGPIKELLIAGKDAQILGLNIRDFSLLSPTSRCCECEGRGIIIKKAKFLAIAQYECPTCNGKKYGTRVLQAKYREMSIDEIMSLSIDQAKEFFVHHKKIVGKLDMCQQLGLGYLSLGQPSQTLSGGEAQRLKLVPILAKANLSESTMLIMEEPSLGLHPVDRNLLIKVVQKLNQRGCSVVIIDNNEEFLASSHWVLELGPGSGDQGGKIVFAGGVEKYFALKS